MLRFARTAAALAASGFLTGCSTWFAYTNEEIAPSFFSRLLPGQQQEAPRIAQRATLAVDGERGNRKVLFFLALSGGGSRAAYLSGATMLALQTVFDDVDLLSEVDVISSVSGGSLPAAYYAVTRDDALPLKGEQNPLKPALQWTANTRPSANIEIDREHQLLTCSGPITDAAERADLEKRLPAAAAARIVDLCRQRSRSDLRVWDRTTVVDLMQRNYLGKWIASWFWPPNVVKYWLTGYRRTDIMANVLESQLYDTPLLGSGYSFADVGLHRPYLIINAASASEQLPRDHPRNDPFPFASLFTFTDDDFTSRLKSNVRPYSVARAVAASAAFPVVFESQTLFDYRPCDGNGAAAEANPCEAKYLHIFDGGNADNLGLKSIKRSLLELQKSDQLQNYDSIVVLLVDAFTKPPEASGRPRAEPSPRSALGMLADTALLAADSVLHDKRNRTIAEFRGGKLRWAEECSPASRHFPPKFCAELARLPSDELDIGSRLTFYHFGFHETKDPTLRRLLGEIPTSFAIDGAHVKLIDAIVDETLTSRNSCLRAIRAIVLSESDAAAERQRCVARQEPLPDRPIDADSDSLSR